MGIQQIDFEKQYTIDYERKKRTGAPEIIYGEGKTKEQIEAIIADMLENGQDAIFASRVDEEKAAYLQARFPKLEYDKAARVLVWRQDWNTVNPGRICVVCAGTSDVPVAMEAVFRQRRRFCLRCRRGGHSSSAGANGSNQRRQRHRGRRGHGRRARFRRWRAHK
ncbi:hypothetical protein [uncultured Dubosiella sp.]|uniref:hypothetical protein n=1 Tax=uncultured Dubosiella sp. TaxID=1937011 RepID=UPI00272FEA6B|nr:hypothetical protein [uncultured Dubosiella sp.]